MRRLAVIEWQAESFSGQQPWRKRSRSRSFAAWTACEKYWAGLRKNPPLQRRPPSAPSGGLRRPLRRPLRTRPCLRETQRRRLRRSRTRRKPLLNPGSGIASAGSGRGSEGLPAREAQTASKDLSLSEAANPWKTSCTLPQLFSAFIRSSQRLMFGYAE